VPNVKPLPELVPPTCTKPVAGHRRRDHNISVQIRNIRNISRQTIQKLLDHGFDVNSVDFDGCTPLARVVDAPLESAADTIKVALLLLAAGADPNIYT